MQKPTILQILSMYHEAGEKILQEGAEVIRTDSYDIPHLCEMVGEVEGIVLRAPAKITREVIDAAPKLRVISGAGVGLDNIDVAYATMKGIPVLHAPAVNGVSTAEHTIMLMMALSKNVIPFHLEMREGNYNSRMHIPSFELKGKTVGIVGFGTIGKEAARMAKEAFGMNVIAWVRKYEAGKHGLVNQLGINITEDLDSLFRIADFVLLHVPLSSGTRGFINKHHFQLMKKTAYLVNTARGAIVNERDLYESLVKGGIAGAALDVFEEEPPRKDSPLLKLPNVILTPHVAGTTVECNYVMATTVARNVLRLLRG